MVARSEESKQAILQATLDLLGVGEGEGLTVQKLTIEAIAKRAGVSKVTIYRWWGSKAAVVLDAFVGVYLPLTEVRDDLPFVEALNDHVCANVRQYSGPDGPVIAQLIAESQYDDDTLAEFHRRFWDDRRDAVIGLMHRGRDEGALRPDIDLAIAGTLIYAPIYQHLLLRDSPLDEDSARTLIGLAMEGIGAKP
ncbi:MAG: TetR/AcrR family transcriptional regulator [Leucobacter sp.]